MKAAEAGMAVWRARASERQREASEEELYEEGGDGGHGEKGQHRAARIQDEKPHPDRIFWRWQ